MKISILKDYIQGGNRVILIKHERLQGKYNCFEKTLFLPTSSIESLTDDEVYMLSFKKTRVEALETFNRIWAYQFEEEKVWDEIPEEFIVRNGFNEIVNILETITVETEEGPVEKKFVRNYKLVAPSDEEIEFCFEVIAPVKKRIVIDCETIVPTGTKFVATARILDQYDELVDGVVTMTNNNKTCDVAESFLVKATHGELTAEVKVDVVVVQVKKTVEEQIAELQSTMDMILLQ